MTPAQAQALAALVLALAGVKAPADAVTLELKIDTREIGEYLHGAAASFDAPRDPSAVFTAPQEAAFAGAGAIDATPDADAEEDDVNAEYEAAGGTLPTTDKHGIPWDKRIHSTPAKLSDKSGEWRRKRDVQESLVNEVTAELRAKAALERAAIPQPPAPPATATVPIAPPPPATSASVVPAPPPSPETTASSRSDPSPLSPPAAVVTPVMRFGQVMKKITGAQTAGRILPTRPLELAQGLGLNSVADLMRSDIETIDAFEALIDLELA
jgi:hypothetical protein